MTLGPFFTMPTTVPTTLTSASTTTSMPNSVRTEPSNDDDVPSLVPAEPSNDDDDDKDEDDDGSENINATGDPHHSRNTPLQSAANTITATTLFRTVTISLITVIIYVRLLI